MTPEDGNSQQSSQNFNKETPASPPEKPIFSKKKRSNAVLLTLVFGLLFAGVGSYIVWKTFAATNNDRPNIAHEHNIPEPFVDKPEHGLIWAGLKAPQAGGPCGHLYEVANVHSQQPLCTHGPDPAPEGVDVRKGQPIKNAETVNSTTAAVTADPNFACDGDGTSGNRVEGLYVRASDVPSRFPAITASLQSYAGRANNQYLNSARETGSERRIRWVHDTTCYPIIKEVVIPPTADDNFGASIDALAAQGYNRSDRKYMMWVDAAVECGISTIIDDDSPGSNNKNNYLQASYARSDSGCWNYAEAHELMHGLGGVQPSAPNATPGYHCTDESDEMCYVDASGIVMRNICVGRDGTLFDCNHDDYYYAGTPPAGNYLASHWNTANSSFLIGGGSIYIPVQCNNGLNDDGNEDAWIDYPADPGCISSTDTTESPNPPPPADTTAPTVFIAQPANNATVKRTVSIYANGGDNLGSNNVKKMEIYIDGVSKVTKNATATASATPIDYSWNTSKVTKTSHTITVKAYDAAGNVGQTSITVTVVK